MTKDKTPVLLLGGGGHCASVIDVIENNQTHHIVGIIEAHDSNSTGLLGYPVIGTDDQLEQLLKQTPCCIITVGQLKSTLVREMLYKHVKQFGGQLPTLVSNSSRVASSATLAEGVVVLHQCFINHFVEIGCNTIINNHALVEHGAMIGDFCHISTGSIINGDVEIGHKCLIGSGAVVIQGLTICDEVVIGAGSVVVKDIHERGVYVGNPAKWVKSL